MRGKTFDREYLVSQIAMLRIEGKSTHFILDFLKKEVGMGQTTAYEVLRDAQDYIMKMTNEDLGKAYAESIQQIERKMESVKDQKTWLQYRAELNKLRGLYAAQKIEHTGQVQIAGIDIQIISGTESSEPKKEDDNNGTKSV